MDTFVNDIQLIYDRLGDEISQEIFINRMVYNLTGNMKSLRNVVRTFSRGKEFLEKINQAVEAKRKICIFGIGIWGRSILNSNPDVNFYCFVDNNRDKCKMDEGGADGMPVFHFDEWIKKKEDMTVIISTRLFHQEIYSQLKAYRVRDELIIDAGAMLDEANKIQYFDLPQLRSGKAWEEVFVDVGAFDGQTSLMFTQWAENFKKIFALEPEPQNREKCQKTLKVLSGKYEILPFGAWDKQERLSFTTGLNGASHISGNRPEKAEKQITIQVDKLDNLIHEKVSFIKMDIEGAEMKALKGAENIIKEYKPKLAISVYHKKEDIWEIPSLLLHYVPEYRLYLRHYSMTKDETVLYCIAE